MRKKSKSFCQVDHLELRRLLSTVFVSSAATSGSNNGTSWTNAYMDLQSALSAAGSGDTIEVGQGTYKPTAGTDRTVSFDLKAGVSIQGGYAGTGQSNPDARDVTLHPVILSGDIGTTGDNTDNSYHVVYARNIDSTGVLDGVTITGGNANVGFGNTSQGGGIFDLLASPIINDCIISGNASSGSGAGVANLYSSATLTNCTISGNTSAARGGGIYDYESSPSLTNCTISANTANFNEGGGISNKKSSDPILTNCTISGNSAASGGAIANYSSSSPELTNCILTGNTASEGGGVWNDLNSSPTLINCVISGNTATSAGGGAYSAFTSNPTLTNCTLSGNTAQYGGAIYNNANASTTIANSILWNDTASTSDNEIGEGQGGTNTTNISFSDVEGGVNGVNNNIATDPKFIRAVGNGGPGDFGNLRLQPSSPVINLGSSSASGLNGITTDLDGLSRTNGGFVDMGAYEAHYAFQSTVFVDASATGANTGSTWTDAYSHLAVALDYAVAGETIDVAQGTYYASTDASRFDTFQLIDGVILQGGFAGQADPNAARDVSTYMTTLSGDIGTPGVIGDNTYNVVTGSGTDNTAILDGFTITAGYASNYHPTGGGIIDFSGSPTITDSIISGNTSTGAGGGMFNYQSSPILNDCTINGNTGRSGAGMVNENNSSPVLTDCTISGNSANQGGGGIYNAYSSPTLVSCTISGNSAGTSGGGIYDDHSSPTLINCVLSGNSASETGGALSNTYADSLPTLTNCTLTGNSAGTAGGAVYDLSSAKPTLTNCILWADIAPNENEVDNAVLGTATITFSDIDQSGFAGSNNNIDADPMFIDANESNFHLKIGSAAIDAGSNSAIAGTNTDLDGRPRIINSTVDMGAYEAQPIIFVDASATGTDDGTSWADAFTTLTAALNYATADSGQSIDVAEGTYHPTTGTDRTANFQMKNGVEIQGGFASGGSVTADPAAHPTILSGDIGTVGENGDNSYHVVYVAGGVDSTAVLDGFTITGGNASPVFDGYGGGIEIEGNPTINNCIITGNTAHGGAGVENIYGSPVLTNCIISGNSSTSSGGGLYNYHGSPTLLNCTISGNTAANDGGAIFNHTSGSNEALVLINCIVSGNSASSNGNEIYSHGNSPVTITYSDIDPTGIAGTGTVNLDSTDIDADPQFVRAVGTNGVSDFGDLHLLGVSPAINVGSNTAIVGTTADLDGNARIVEGTVDMGAYEAFPNHLAIFAQPASTETAGADLPVVIQIEDQYGSVFAGDDSTVTIALAVAPSGATLGGTSSLATQNGIATFNDFFLTKAGSYVLAFSNGSLPIATSNTFTITAASPASLAISQQPGNATAGQDIPALQVEVEDQYGNLADGSSVTVAIASGPGTTLGGTTTLATSGGVASFSDLTLTAAGAYALSLSDGSLAPATSNSFTISPAAPAALVITQQPVDTIAGQTMPAVDIEVEDQYGNAVDGTSVTLTVASGPSGSALGGTLTLPTANGIASFDNLTLDRAGAFTLSASDGNLPAVTSQSFALTFAGPQLVFDAEPISAAAGAKLPAITVDTDDASGNIVTTGKSTVILTLSAGGKIYGQTKAKVKNGVATFKNLSIHTAGPYTLTASDSSFASAVSSEFTIGAGAAKKLAFDPQPANVAANTPFNVSVELLDKYGNAVNDGSTVDLVLGSHPKTAASLNLITIITDGVADFDGVTLATTGNYSLKANDGKAKATSKKFAAG